ncbi:site-specific integrase [Paraburkholderia sp. JPY432]|uniref:site-specific integrase n=1 Tax=Paraburkholderia youngii TaxID=2782701 RepID=UPI001595EB47|nr:site-specific integrase [Paraburkholderia youngii]NVH76113.1 site-specific integrase [Paraburkholderia youngii]
MSRPNPSQTANQLARKLVSSVLALGQSKTTLGTLAGCVIVSVGTARDFEQCVRDFLRWRVAGGQGIDAPVTRLELEEYLFQESDRWRQKTLDQHRQALSLVYTVALTRLEAQVPTFTNGRAYIEEEMEKAARHQSPRNALGTRAAFRSGLRAIELIELREAHELPPQPDRPWRTDLFLGLPEGVIYRTNGKGGLARSVWIPTELHEQLQTRRLAAPLNVIDRKINRQAVFDIGGGQSLSQSFSRASMSTLGFSLGFHGLRHAYAQNRLETLVGMGVDLLDAFEIISQEVGHLRPDVLWHYTPRRKA